MQELFEHFEVNRQPRWPILSRLAGLSILFHASILACVLYVPGLRESFNIAALMARTHYVDRAYNKTEIGEDVQVVNVGEKFRYPEGYFAIANPESVNASVNNPGVTIFPDPWAPSPSDQVAEVPSPSPSPSPEISPEVSPESSPGTAIAESSPSSSPSPGTDTSAVDQQLNKIAEDNSVVRPSDNEVNTRPLKDWLARANLLKQKGELDLTSQVDIKIEANLTSQCKLQDAKVVQKSGDTRLLEVAKDMVSAIGDSGMLSFLRDPKKVQNPDELRCDEFPLTLSIKLDQNEIQARVESQAESAARAAEMAKGYSGLLTIGQYLKRGRDEELLYKNTKVTAEGKQIFVNFSMPRHMAGEMLKKQLPAG